MLFLSNPAGMDAAGRRRMLDRLRALNQLRLDAVGDPEIQTRISQYELAYRMQTSVPEVMDISKETKQTHELYGTKPGQKAFSNNCLLAQGTHQFRGAGCPDCDESTPPVGGHVDDAGDGWIDVQRGKP